jgi:hypothetical protein
MAKLDKTNIVTGNVITAADLANVYNALGGTGAADIMVSGTLSAMNGLTVSGSILPHSGSAFDLGSSSKPWKDLHLSGSTVYLWSSAGTAETLSRGNLQNIKEGKPLRGKGSLSSATLQCNFIYRDDDTADGDSTNRIALLNDRIYAAVNNLYAWDAKYSTGGGNQMSFGNYKKDDQAANYYFEGSISSNNTISAVSFVGDGSKVTGVTAEWDGTHNGDAEITGTLTAGALCADNIMYIYNGTYYSVEQQVAMLKTATGNLYSSITSNDNDISSINTSISGLETATGNLLTVQNSLATATGNLYSSITSNDNDISSINTSISGLETATGTLLSTQTSQTISINNLNTSANTAANDITSLKSATGTNWNGWNNIKNGTSTGNYNAYNLTANKLYATNNLITVYDDIKLSQSNLEVYNGAVSAQSMCADALYVKSLPGTNPGDNGEIWKQPLSACFLGSTSGDMLNALGSASSDLQTVLYGS